MNTLKKLRTTIVPGYWLRHERISLRHSFDGRIKVIMPELVVALLNMFGSPESRLQGSVHSWTEFVTAKFVGRYISSPSLAMVMFMQGRQDNSEARSLRWSQSVNVRIVSLYIDKDL